LGHWLRSSQPAWCVQSHFRRPRLYRALHLELSDRGAFDQADAGGSNHHQAKCVWHLQLLLLPRWGPLLDDFHQERLQLLQCQLWYDLVRIV
ncbi:unnamed protein product, partial [Aphanomyces euteiches]